MALFVVFLSRADSTINGLVATSRVFLCNYRSCRLTSFHVVTLVSNYHNLFLLLSQHGGMNMADTRTFCLARFLYRQRLLGSLGSRKLAPNVHPDEGLVLQSKGRGYVTLQRFDSKIIIGHPRLFPTASVCNGYKKTANTE